ncbi:MAG: ribonuclease E/G [Holosporaceae bacterium]|nr:ribonuclease E/G [Holosporaceae bacterium]
MSKSMLIDSAHLEEIRVAIVDGNRLERFDTEAASRTPTRGNIYLAKVVRVEPSLQAAFVDYGEERHGFLSFSEIHHDYFQIPVGDREELENRVQNAIAAQISNESAVEESDSIDDAKEISRIRYQFYKRYKIQEVIKKRQIMLVQVTKEERGNKGAAITTYISLAGKYCVLMPNMAKGSGVSRKIVNGEDRAKLKKIVSELHVENGSVVIRTAGVGHSKVEIRKDFDYLRKLWDEIRENTLKSTAPCLIYEEASIIKRTIRDFYSRDIDSIFIEGEEGFKVAKNFVKKLMPSHVKKVKLYDDRKVPLFSKFKINDQVHQIYSSRVDLPSGGYLIISPTEALISIDVNSGRSTRERNIAGTALKTNLEAASEIARQCKLRDLAGLIVVDFIDMDEKRNNVQVEKCLREALREDKAKIQLGSISTFGLLEFSRQRLRSSIVDANMIPCPHCAGSGSIWSNESVALQILRRVEETCATLDIGEIIVTLSLPVAMYMLNHKREFISHVEKRSEAIVKFNIDNLAPIDGFKIEQVIRQSAELVEGPAAAKENKAIKNAKTFKDVSADSEHIAELDAKDSEDEAEKDNELQQSQSSELLEGHSKPKSRRRRNRRRKEAIQIAGESVQLEDAAPVQQQDTLFHEISNAEFGTGIGHEENIASAIAPPTTNAATDLSANEISVPVSENVVADNVAGNLRPSIMADTRHHFQKRRKKSKHANEEISLNAESQEISKNAVPNATVFSLNIKKTYGRNRSRENVSNRQDIDSFVENLQDGAVEKIAKKNYKVADVKKNNFPEQLPTNSRDLFPDTNFNEFSNNKQFAKPGDAYKIMEDFLETNSLQINATNASVSASKNKKNSWWQRLLKKPNIGKNSKKTEK